MWRQRRRARCGWSSELNACFLPSVQFAHNRKKSGDRKSPYVDTQPYRSSTNMLFLLRLRPSIVFVAIAMNCHASSDGHRNLLGDAKTDLYAGAAGAFRDILDGTSPLKTGEWKRRRLAGSLSTTLDASAWEEIQQDAECAQVSYEVSFLFAQNHFGLVAIANNHAECPALAFDGYPHDQVEESTAKKALLVQAHRLNELGKIALATQENEDSMLSLGFAPLSELVAAFDLHKNMGGAAAYHLLNNNCIHPLVDICNSIDSLEIRTIDLLDFLLDHIEDMAYQTGNMAEDFYQYILKEDAGKLYEKGMPMEAAVELYLKRLVLAEK